ncbi:MAG: hypothetical protein AB1567_06530 [bacterium]
MKKVLSKLVVSVSILYSLSGVSLVQAQEEIDVISSVATPTATAQVKEKKHYTFRLGKVRMKDTYNHPSISKDIKDVLLIRFLIPSKDVEEEHPFYEFDEGFGNWCKDHLDFHIGVSTKGEPNLFLIGGNIEINKFVDIVGGISLSQNTGYEHHMYYYGITFDSQFFHHIVDMVQQTIKMAEK